MSTELVENGFGTPGGSNLMVSEVGAVAAVAREQSEIQAASIMAKKFPRDEAAAYAKLMKCCERKGVAEDAEYVFPRGGKDVSGPSVYITREIARVWGNVRFGLRIVSVDDLVHIKGYALDLETNTYVEMEDKFARKIQRKRDGVTVWIEPDERDLRELINRRGAILVRNALLQVLPSDIVDDCLSKSAATLRSIAKGELKANKTDVIRKLVVAFDAFGVSTEMLERKLGHALELVNEDEIVTLRGIYKSISDNHTKREEHFSFPESKEQSAAASELQAQIEARRAEEAKKKAEAQAKGETQPEVTLSDTESDLADEGN